jgi:hypothetical protein
VAITLGKNCVISVGSAVGSARNVTFTGNARTIDIEEFGSRKNCVYNTGYDLSVSFEFNDSADLSFTQLLQGTLIEVSGGAAGSWSFPAVVTSIVETDPLDGVATFNVECRLTREGLR